MLDMIREGAPQKNGQPSPPSSSSPYTVLTAGDGLVLGGTVRRLLLEVCEREGIPVVFEPPLVAEAGGWEACFVSSTSRLLLPVDELYAPAEGQVSGPGDLLRAFDNGPGSVAEKLVDLVQSEVVSHSSAVKGGVEAE